MLSLWVPWWANGKGFVSWPRELDCGLVVVEPDGAAQKTIQAAPFRAQEKFTCLLGYQNERSE